MYDTHIYDVLFAYKCETKSGSAFVSVLLWHQIQMFEAARTWISFFCYQTFGDKFSNLPEKANEKQIKSLNIIDI